jgi:predicted RNA-binding Zn ribbon-like protein
MPPPAPAPGEADHLALALANTRRTSEGGAVDDLDTPARAAEWFAEHGLLPARARVTARQATVARALRDAARALFLARIEGTSADRTALGVLSTILRAAPGAPGVRWHGSSPPVRTWQHLAGDRFQRALATLAADAVDVLCDAGPLAGCARPGCIRFLIRDDPRRHWCSTACGDRVRASRYYARHRAR